MQQLDINFDTAIKEPAVVMEQKETTEVASFADTVNPAPATGGQQNPFDLNFRILFEELQHAFITRSRKDIAIELKKIENRTALLQDKINTLHSEVDRLSAIDLDTEFRRMQGTLAQIAQTVNGINSTFNHSISGMGENVGDGLSATNEAIKRHAEDAAKQLTKLDEETKTNILFLEHKIQALAEQNRQLKKGIKSNNIILVIGLVLLLGALGYIIAYQAGVRINMH